MRGGLRLHAGLELSGRYRLAAPVGRGGMGEVTVKARGDACLPRRAVVWTVAMAAGRDASALGPIVFTVYADREVTPQAGDDVLKKVVGSIRPYECPQGLTPRNNVCSTPTGTPTP